MPTDHLQHVGNLVVAKWHRSGSRTPSIDVVAELPPSLVECHVGPAVSGVAATSTISFATQPVMA